MEGSTKLLIQTSLACSGLDCDAGSGRWAVVQGLDQQARYHLVSAPYERVDGGSAIQTIYWMLQAFQAGVLPHPQLSYLMIMVMTPLAAASRHHLSALLLRLKAISWTRTIAAGAVRAMASSNVLHAQLLSETVNAWLASWVAHLILCGTTGSAAVQ